MASGRMFDQTIHQMIDQNVKLLSKQLMADCYIFLLIATMAVSTYIDTYILDRLRYQLCFICQLLLLSSMGIIGLVNLVFLLPNQSLSCDLSILVTNYTLLLPTTTLFNNIHINASGTPNLWERVLQRYLCPEEDHHSAIHETSWLTD